MTPTSNPVSGLIDTNYMASHSNIYSLKRPMHKQSPISSKRNRFRCTLFCHGTDYMATFLGINPHNPCHIPTSNQPPQKMNDVVAVLSDPFFFISDVQHELSKRKLKVSGCKDDLLWRLFEALKAEHAEGWTLGYLLNTKVLPFNGNGIDPGSLVGCHLQRYKCDGDGVMVLELSDGEDVTIRSNKSCDNWARIKMDNDLFWALHTLDGMNAVPRNLAKKPLLITEAALGVRKDRWGKEAGIVLGLRLEGMRAISFLFLAREASIREDRICGDVWLADDVVLREDIRMLHGGDEMMVEAAIERRVMTVESRGLEEDVKVLHGY